MYPFSHSPFKQNPLTGSQCPRPAQWQVNVQLTPKCPLGHPAMMTFGDSVNTLPLEVIRWLHAYPMYPGWHPPPSLHSPWVRLQPKSQWHWRLQFCPKKPIGHSVKAMRDYITWMCRHWTPTDAFIRVFIQPVSQTARAEVTPGRIHTGVRASDLITFVYVCKYVFKLYRSMTYKCWNHNVVYPFWFVFF